MSSENKRVKLSQDVRSVCSQRKRLLVSRRHEASSVNHYDKRRAQDPSGGILESLAQAAVDKREASCVDASSSRAVWITCEGQRQLFQFHSRGNHCLKRRLYSALLYPTSDLPVILSLGLIRETKAEQISGLIIRKTNYLCNNGYVIMVLKNGLTNYLLKISAQIRVTL